VCQTTEHLLNGSQDGRLLEFCHWIKAQVSYLLEKSLKIESGCIP
jgi:hypothetical protein